MKIERREFFAHSTEAQKDDMYTDIYEALIADALSQMNRDLQGYYIFNITEERSYHTVKPFEDNSDTWYTMYAYRVIVWCSPDFIPTVNAIDDMDDFDETCK